LIKTKKELEEFLLREAAVEPGKVVRLKSGGSAMTVRSITKNKVVCEWFERNGRLRTHVFLLHSLIGTAPDGGRRRIVVIGDLPDENGE
jgi:uncharacterized protein YodC (DUF2158 family)